MKKIILMFALAAAFFILPSCNQQPEFEFQVEVTSNVYDEPSKVSFVMPTSIVTNLPTTFPVYVAYTDSLAVGGSDHKHCDKSTVDANTITQTPLKQSMKMFAQEVDHKAAQLTKASENPTPENIANGEDFIDKYMNEVIIPKISATPNTRYYVHVKGFVREKLSGVTIAIDKTFSNWGI